MSSDLILPGDTLPSFAKPPFVILLVDDRPFVAEAIQRLLSDEADISLVYCPDPFKALEMAEKVDPTVILLDAVMPDMDGFTLCRFFRAYPRTRDRPVIMLSGSDDSPVKMQAFAAGANDYLVKLPDKIELIARLRYHSGAYLGKMEGDKARLALQTCRVKVDDLYGEVNKLVRHDGLTGLDNRKAFEERCRDMWSLAKRHSMPISLIMMNLDYFTSFNEQYGQPKGDECLKEIAKLCRQRVRRPSDVLARFTDGHFIALLPATPAEGATHVAELLRSGVEQLAIPHCKNSEASRLTISLGVATATPGRGANFEAMLKLAEDCLNRSKELGHNRFQMALLHED